MEVSVLSEQVDAQSNKIQELESLLQEKRDTLRQMEEVLQKVNYLMMLLIDLELYVFVFIGSFIKKRVRDAEVGTSYLLVRNETQTGQFGARKSIAAQYKSFIEC